jgi:predicted nucleotidyltransferase
MILRVDNDGFLINDGNIKNISPELLVILNKLVSFSKRELGNNFLSAYIRGSVSVGRFIKNISDIDFVVITKIKPDQKNFNNFLNHSLKLNKKYFWVEDFDLFLVDKNTLFNSPELNKLRVYLSTQSVLIAGEDIINGLERYKPDKKLANTLLSEIDNEFLFLKNIFSSVEQNFSYNNQTRPLNFWCVWMSRVVLRFSLYASLEKHHFYTNDLKDCYKIVSEIYPELEPDLNLALLWSQFPSNDRVVLNDYIGRVSKKIKEIFIINNK